MATELTEPAGVSPEMLTSDEFKAMQATVTLWNLMCNEVVGDGPGRKGDLQEIRFHIHGLQRAIMGQAAARAYPDQFRLLGGSVLGG